MKLLKLALSITLIFSLNACSPEPEPDPLVGTTWINEDGSVTIDEETEYAPGENDEEIVVGDSTYYAEDSEQAKEIAAKKELEEKKNSIKELLAGTWYAYVDQPRYRTFVLPNATTITSEATPDWVAQTWTGTFEINDDLSLTTDMTLQGFEDQEFPVDRHQVVTRQYTEDPNEAIGSQDFYFINEQTLIISEVTHNRV